MATNKHTTPARRETPDAAVHKDTRAIQRTTSINEERIRAAGKRSDLSAAASRNARQGARHG